MVRRQIKYRISLWWNPLGFYGGTGNSPPSSLITALYLECVLWMVAEYFYSILVETLPLPSG